MKASTWLRLLLVLLVLGVAAFGFARLFVLRFQAGDVYPPYSTLRADPLGCKALYDGLGEVASLKVSRCYDDHPKFPEAGRTTFLVAGTDLEAWRQADVEEMEAFVRQGGRLVVTLTPAAVPAKAAAERKAEAEEKPRQREKKDAERAKKGEDDSAAQRTLGQRALAARWGFGIGFRPRHPHQGDEKAESAALMAEAVPGMTTEPTLSWHTALHFTSPVEAWHTLYRCEGDPVFMERAFGQGLLVIAADSYFLSNEAMRAERTPRLLSWVVGDRPLLIFDETHLGIRENPGLSTLARKYGLEGALVALAILAGLFVWQTASPFMPPPPERTTGEEEIVEGKDATSGFISLLRLGVSPDRLMETCLEQWRRAQTFSRKLKPGTLERLEAAAAEGRRTPVAAYQRITQILAEKK